MTYHQKESPAQNFIKYPGLVTELLNGSDISQKDLVLEIGPGKGIITSQLCQRAGEVIAVEKDVALYGELVVKFKEQINLKIVCQDILRYGLPTVPYKIFSNIPFSITAEIMNRILKSDNLPSEIYLIMQKEAAEKFIGIPNESQSSILAKPFFEIEVLGEIDRTNFLFKPQVKIVFVKFKKRQKAFIKDEDRRSFWGFVEYGFAQWRPTWVESYKKKFSFEQMDRLKKIFKLGEKKLTEVDFDTWLLAFKAYLKLTSPRSSDTYSSSDFLSITKQ